ncbi:DUF2059 domain-containing protein [Sphingomonas sp.]|uniref:DUF2059 domain-containing protein n=1 Tax=Sphingomonas sp. TaxID=28214 RepID=UPI001ECA1A7C|nr:DUF2059 domain-containing protein [Sphingomonas sp.]MBX3594931.1 DUF2059 domain-containing protein [Sphingomonas sp.]
MKVTAPVLAALMLVPLAPMAQAAPGVPAATAADADAAARLTTARAIVELSMPESQRDAMFGQMMDAMMANMLGGMMKGDPKLAATLRENPEAARVFAAFVARQKQLSLADLKQTTPEMIEAIAQAYARRFTLAELTQIEAFVRTDAGARFVQAGPTLFSDPAIAAWQRGIAEKAQARMPAEINRLLTDLKPVLKDADAAPAKS